MAVRITDTRKKGDCVIVNLVIRLVIHHYGSLDGKVEYVGDEVRAMYSTDLQYTGVMHNTVHN